MLAKLSWYSTEEASLNNAFTIVGENMYHGHGEFLLNGERFA